MTVDKSNFSAIVASVYNLPLNEKLELKNLLEHNISDALRDDILSSYNSAQEEHKKGTLKFKDNADELLNML